MPDAIHGTERRPLVVGTTLFDYADEVSAAVPESCRRTGRCRECVVEVRQGAERLSPRTDPEAYLAGGFRLACQAHIEDDDRRRRVRDHPPPDAHPRAVRRAAADIDPVVTADEHAVRYDGQPIDLRADARPRPGHRHRDDDGRLPAHRPADRARRGGRRAREPAALRRQRRHDPHLVRAGLPGRDAPGAAARPQPRAARPLPRARHRPARGLRGHRSSPTARCATSSSASTSRRSASCRTSRSPSSRDAATGPRRRPGCAGAATRSAC